MSTDTGLRGLDLLDAVIAQIEARPETWDQEVYRCRTGMCVAGWAAQLAGGRWAADPDSEWSDALFAEADDDPGCVQEMGWDAPEAAVRVVDASDRARRLLGLSVDPGPGGYLFAAHNTLADIKRIRDQIAANAEATP